MPILHVPHQGPMVCVACGCTDERACVDLVTGEPCHWVEPGLCSGCACPLPGPNITFEQLRADAELLLASTEAWARQQKDGGDGRSLA